MVYPILPSFLWRDLKEDKVGTCQNCYVAIISHIWTGLLLVAPTPTPNLPTSRISVCKPEAPHDPRGQSAPSIGLTEAIGSGMGVGPKLANETWFWDFGYPVTMVGVGRTPGSQETTSWGQETA